MRRQLFLLPAALVTLSLVACNTSWQGPDDTIPDENGAQSSGPFLDDASSSSETTVLELSSAESAGEVSQADVESVDPVTGVKTINISATNWDFSPATITVKKGEKVQLIITADKGTHGFAIPALSMNVRVEEGQSATVDLPTDQAGTYDAFCSVPCGEGHKEMKATVIIEE